MRDGIDLEQAAADQRSLFDVSQSGRAVGFHDLAVPPIRVIPEYVLSAFKTIGFDALNVRFSTDPEISPLNVPPRINGAANKLS